MREGPGAGRGSREGPGRDGARADGAPGSRAVEVGAREGELELVYEPREHWPPLAWVARCPRRGGPVRVLHGEDVETRDGWFCEAVWDGDFREGGFDRTALIFGSGARLRGDGLVFVSAFAPVDRLHLIHGDDALWVSNSLAGLLRVVDGTVDPTRPDYLYFFRSICRGIDDYRRHLDTTAGPVELVYHRNVRWDGEGATLVEKPRDDEAPFSDFRSYRDYLAGRLAALGENLSAAGRRSSLGMLGTISSGYDSSAVCALARDAGLERALNFGSTPRGKPDSGVEPGRHLGIEVVQRPIDGWKRIPGAEVPVLAGAATAGEIYFQGAEDLLGGSVVLTGQAGAVWRTGRHHQRLRSDLARGDPSGLSLTEYRLWAGFLRVPVPHIGARHSDRILEITLSDEMEPWHRGGYNKPIPRRICEEAGVPPEAFGQDKRYGAVSLGTKRTFWSVPSLEDYLGWLGGRSGDWWRRGRPPPRWISRAATPAQAGARAAAGIVDRLPVDGAAARRLRKRLRFLGTREYLYKFMFPWALDRAKDRYGG